MKLNKSFLLLLIGISIIFPGCNSRRDDFENRVRTILKDPDSAKFRNVEINKFCMFGEINSKNSMGGYTGFSRFFVNDEKIIVAETTDESIKALDLSTICLQKLMPH